MIYKNHRDLERFFANSVNQKRFELGIDATVPLGVRAMTERLSGSGFMYLHGVISRRMGYSYEMCNKLLEESIVKLSKQCNQGRYPTPEMRNAVLHPPIESFTNPQKDPEYPEIQSDDVCSGVGRAITAIEGNVVFVNFVSDTSPPSDVNSAVAV